MPRLGLHGISTLCPRRRRDTPPRNVHVAVAPAVAPRRTSTVCPRGTRGGAATRSPRNLHVAPARWRRDTPPRLSTWHPRWRRDTAPRNISTHAAPGVGDHHAREAVRALRVGRGRVGHVALVLVAVDRVSHVHRHDRRLGADALAGTRFDSCRVVLVMASPVDLRRLVGEVVVRGGDSYEASKYNLRHFLLGAPHSCRVGTCGSDRLLFL